MNGYVIILCALLHTISPLSLASPDASGPTRLRIGYDYQPPYRYTDENLNAVGIDIDRISAILDAAGVSYSFHPYPWKRILLNIERGSIDIALSAGRLKEREKYALFSNSIFRYGSNALFVSNEYIEHFANFDELSDLKPLPVWIGVRRAASYSDEYEKLLEDTVFAEKLVVLNDIPQSIKLALSKRIQGFIASQIWSIMSCEICVFALNSPWYMTCLILKK